MDIFSFLIGFSVGVVVTIVVELVISCFDDEDHDDKDPSMFAPRGTCPECRMYPQDCECEPRPKSSFGRDYYRYGDTKP